MHGTVQDFIEGLKSKVPEIFKAGRVLEVGSYDINGTPRQFFDTPVYIGLDWRGGPGVDVVGVAHECQMWEDGYFDVIVSTSTAEHDPHWAKTIIKMIDLLKVGGSIIFTCAGPGFPVHEVYTAPEGFGVPRGTYYAGRRVCDILAVAAKAGHFELVHAASHNNEHDTFIFLHKKQPRRVERAQEATPHADCTCHHD